MGVKGLIVSNISINWSGYPSKGHWNLGTYRIKLKIFYKPTCWLKVMESGNYLKLSWKRSLKTLSMILALKSTNLSDIAFQYILGHYFIPFLPHKELWKLSVTPRLHKWGSHGTADTQRMLSQR